MMRRQYSRRALFFAALLGAAGVSTFTVSQASAQTSPSLQTQATQLESQITANAAKLNAINEQINGAHYALQQADATIADSQARIAAAKAQTDELEAQVDQRAAAIYRSAGTGADTSIFDINPTELVSSQQYTAAASDQDNALIAELNESRQELNSREKEAQSAKAQAEKESAALAAAQASFQSSNSQYNALLGQVKGQLAPLVAQAQAQTSARLSAPTFSGPLPAPSGSAGVAIRYAEAQLGKPYCYAGTGPGCYDCSGLTMMAWGAAGVGMAHYSGAQYDAFPHVPMNELQPGDLVFTADPGQHVGLYVGGGEVIHAPQTGQDVGYIGVSYFSLAARP
jgi:cell wall-associated NlpC family hydrolase